MTYKSISPVYFIALIVLLTSCKEKKIDVEEGKAVVESLLTNIDKENFEAVEELYTPAFNANEPIDVKREKLLELKSVLGNLVSFKLQEHRHEMEFAQPQKLILVYQVTYTNNNTVESFAVVEETGGLKVAAHSVRAVGN
jgi:hypothetical protein